MESKTIEFEQIQDFCKFCTQNEKCENDDNYTGECKHQECPIWCDLITDELEY